MRIERVHREEDQPERRGPEHERVRLSKSCHLLVVPLRDGDLAEQVWRFGGIGQVEITASAASCSLTSNAIYTYFVTRSYP